MRIKKRYIIVLILILMVVLYIGCKEEGETEKEQDIIINFSGEIVEEASGNPIEGIEIKYEDTENNKVYTARSDSDGNFNFQITAIAGKTKGLFKINFDMAKNYIPVLIVSNGDSWELTLKGKEENQYNVKVDLIKKWGGKYNRDNTPWYNYICVYRGRDAETPGGLNVVWVKRPDRFIVYDPHNVLKQYNDLKRNPVMDNIRVGFKAAEQYSCGVVRAPSLDEIEIKYEEAQWSDGDMFFEITDGDAFAEEFVDHHEIKRSGAGGGPSPEPMNYVSEIVSSIQGGDNEGGVPSIFGINVHLSEQDKNWGRLNYKKREPGSRIVIDFTSPFGFLIETRILDKIKL